MPEVNRDQASAAASAAGRSVGNALRSRPEVVRVIAHRGSGHGRNDPDAPPENTLAAVAYGFQQGADAVEIDVWCTRDGVPVLHHDATTDRTTDLAGRGITSVDFDELASVSAGSWKSNRWATERVPTLLAATTIIPGGRALIVEVEEGPQVADIVVQTLVSSALTPEQTVLITYNLDTAAELKRIAPQLRVFWILNTRPGWEIGGWSQGHRRGRDGDRVGYDEHADSEWIVNAAVAAGVDGIDTLFAYPPDLPGLAAAAGLKWMVWTANDPRAIDQCLFDGAWAITTDNTRTVGQWLAAAGVPTATKAGVAF